MDEFNPQFTDNNGTIDNDSNENNTSSNAANDNQYANTNSSIEGGAIVNTDVFTVNESKNNAEIESDEPVNYSQPSNPTNTISGDYMSADADKEAPTDFISGSTQSAGASETLKGTTFYTENFRKQSGGRRKDFWKLALVSVVSAFIGAFIFGAVFLIAAPAIQPALRSFLDGTVENSSTNNNGLKEMLSGSKQVEIVGESNIVAKIAEAVGPTVVGVKVTYQSQGGWLFGSQDGEGVGSGVIIRADGYILTNFHVVQSALDSSTNKISKGSKVEIILPNKNDKPYTAEYIGGDSKTDLAVLKIKQNNLPVAKLGDSDKIKVGELAVAIGNPGGLELAGSVTSGIISGVNRKIDIGNGTQLQLIQTDAAISPGNSGGALVNSNGEVVGINNLKIVSADVEGLGFAIPVNKAKEITDSLIKSGYVRGRPWLGITSTAQFTEEIAKSYNMPYGVYVVEVQMMSGAFKAGIQPNDIITKFDGKQVKSTDEINAIKDKKKPGDTVAVELYRDGKYLTKKVTLTEAKQ